MYNYNTGTKVAAKTKHRQTNFNKSIAMLEEEGNSQGTDAFF
jgi:hypothetical protein